MEVRMRMASTIKGGVEKKGKGGLRLRPEVRDMKHETRKGTWNTGAKP